MGRALLQHRVYQLLGKYWGKWGPAAKWDGAHVTKDTEKAKVINVFFTSGFFFYLEGLEQGSLV